MTLPFSELELLLTLPEVEINYTNWKNSTRWRRIRPLALFYGSSKYHDDGNKHFYVQAIDSEVTGVTEDPFRTFLLDNIHSWRIPE